MKLAPVRLLYIEDNLDDQLILDEYLIGSVNIDTIDHCSMLKESYFMLKEKSYDLILLDLSLPDAHGVEAVIRLNGKIHSSIPIIVLTGLNDHAVAMDSLKHGAQDFIVKGDYNTLLLNKAIRYAIERHKGQLELIRKNREILVSRDRLTKAEEMADLGSWEIDLNSDNVKLSEGMRQLLGTDSKTEVMPFAEFSQFVHEEDRNKCLQALQQTKEDMRPSTVESRFVRSNGDVFYSICKAEIAASISNNHLVIYGVTVDISNIKETERVKQEFTDQLAEKVKVRTQELESAQKKLQKSLAKEQELGELKSRFVSTASHQFRTPLTVIQSNIGLLEMQMEQLELEDNPMLDKIISRIKREIIRMTSIMDEVLILSKINSGGITPILQECDLQEVCSNVLSKYNDIQEDGRSSLIKVTGEHQMISLDKNLFEQAFSNMISNAFKYSKNKPSPEVNITFNKDLVELKVKDYGMGIPQHDLDNLFTPFFRASNVLDIPGTGLGTTIMKEYIELNNGQLSVESETNYGTTFTVRFKTN